MTSSPDDQTSTAEALARAVDGVTDVFPRRVGRVLTDLASDAARAVGIAPAAETIDLRIATRIDGSTPETARTVADLLAAHVPEAPSITVRVARIH
ncbi:hypothetical protein AB0N73_04735 [Microbacterium sp. NPDC089189]|uniref:hypothetical protein n=1 Tax=Microbacterium sp. NPDC089189 TaxID=3154972 RepID=UPI003421A49E